MSELKRKPVVGERLYRVDTGNRARNGKGQQVPVVVKHVGRKYFRVNESMDGVAWTDAVFHVDTWIQASKYSPIYLLFESEQKYLEAKEADELFAELRNRFSVWKNDLPLNKLRQIKAILEP